MAGFGLQYEMPTHHSKMAERLSTLFFIPSYNDREMLVGLVDELLSAHPYALALVVDDGSTPAIEMHPMHPRCRLYRLPCNMGLGLATSIALDYFLDQGLEAFIRLDADGQHPPHVVPPMLRALQTGEAAAVWTERSNHLTTHSARAVAGSCTKQATAGLGRWIFKSPVRDWFSGCYALNRAAAECLARAHLERYCEVQMLCLLHSARLPVQTLEMEQRARAHGISRISWLDGVMIVLRSSLMMALHAMRMPPK
jgi:glycosyltransferase involved in cell wall biosynthesis